MFQLSRAFPAPAFFAGYFPYRPKTAYPPGSDTLVVVCLTKGEKSGIRTAKFETHSNTEFQKSSGFAGFFDFGGFCIKHLAHAPACLFCCCSDASSMCSSLSRSGQRRESEVAVAFGCT